MSKGYLCFQRMSGFLEEKEILVLLPYMAGKAKLTHVISRQKLHKATGHGDMGTCVESQNLWLKR